MDLLFQESHTASWWYEDIRHHMSVWWWQDICRDILDISWLYDQDIHDMAAWS